MKKLLYSTDILIDVYKGIHLVTYYYLDGTKESRKVPKSPIILSEQRWILSK